LQLLRSLPDNIDNKQIEIEDAEEAPRQKKATGELPGDKS
jgi:hypothetical protein